MTLSRLVPSRRFFPALLAIALLAMAAAAQSIGGDVGYYQVTSIPSGADVHFDGQYQGTTPVTIQVYSTSTPGHTVSVSLAGYKTWTQSLSGNPPAGETVTVNAVLEPVVTYGSISVTSSPGGAAIYLNGNYRGVTPLTIPGLTPGTYTLRAEYAGYEPQSSSATVVAGQNTPFYFTLTRIVQTGDITVLSTPSGAYIYLDGDYRGKTPNTVMDISPGTHSLELDLSGYYDWNMVVSVSAGSSQTIPATLSPIKTSTTGWIDVSSKPGGATIWLDGLSRGQTPSSGSKTIDADAGDHTLKLTLSGYQDYLTTVSVKASTTSQVSAALTSVSVPPTTPAASTGTLSVASTPSPANVFVDNAFKGVTPVTLPGIAPGVRTVKIQLGGYQDWTMDVQVLAGQVTPVNAVLVAQPTPTPESGMAPLLVPVALGLILLCLGLRRRT